MKTDDLDTIPDAQLSEVFAVEVCETLKPYPPQKGEARAYEDTRTGAYRSCEWRENFTDFATDANAVLPWLERWGGWSCEADGRDIAVVPHIIDDTKRVHGAAPTFARAACIALIRAKRSSPR